MSAASPLISTDALAARMGEPTLKILDASWHLDGRDARADFVTAHIPGTHFFDLEAVADQGTDLPHMLARPEAFAAFMGALGVTDRDNIVVYDTAGLFSAARAWWMLRTMGVAGVRVLDGGLPKWRAEDRPIEAGAAVPWTAAIFTPRFDAAAVADVPAVQAALSGASQVVDARGPARFRGDTPEPRPGIRPGHMPGAVNLPYTGVLNADGTMKTGAALEAVFTAAGVDPDQPILTTCGSGVTAAILALGLSVLGRSCRLYDGSWSQWGGRADLPAVTG
jgi:thiosulfate/3-mercaptopyruvate sulfurtransferase